MVGGVGRKSIFIGYIQKRTCLFLPSAILLQGNSNLKNSLMTSIGLK